MHHFLISQISTHPVCQFTPQGFSDHVSPPVGVPNPDGLTYTEVAGDGKNYTFNFDRLGVRWAFTITRENRHILHNSSHILQRPNDPHLSLG